MVHNLAISRGSSGCAPRPTDEGREPRRESGVRSIHTQQHVRIGSRPGRSAKRTPPDISVRLTRTPQ
eukprot:408539-Prymnesium_polylepis.1